MHFPIIKLEKADLAREDWDLDLGWEDSTLNYHTDYYGELYDDEERKRVINSCWLKELFDGIAEIDTEKETITFLDADTIRATFSDYLVSLTKNLNEQATIGKLSGYDLREAAYRYKGNEAMFYIDCGYTSFEFIEDACYHAGETWNIGHIFDAHF